MCKIVNKLLIITMLFMLICTQACSNSNDDSLSKDTMAKIERVFDQVKSYKQIKKAYEAGQLIAESVKYFKAPNKFNEVIKVYQNNGKFIEHRKVNDGTNIWSYVPHLNYVTKTESKSLLTSLGTVYFKDENGLHTKAKFIEEDKNYYVFEVLKWHDDVKIFPGQKIIVYFRKDMGCPAIEKYYDYEGNEEMIMTSAYTDINLPLDDALFKFEVPEGISNVSSDLQNSNYVKMGIVVEGRKTLPEGIATKESILSKADNFATGFGFDVMKCEKNITKKDKIWHVQYYNKKGNPSHKRIDFTFSETGYPLSMQRSSE